MKKYWKSQLKEKIQSVTKEDYIWAFKKDSRTFFSISRGTALHGAERDNLPVASGYKRNCRDSNEATRKIVLFVLTFFTYPT